MCTNECYLITDDDDDDYILQTFHPSTLRAHAAVTVLSPGQGPRSPGR